MNKTIAIAGLGWLGKPFALHLQNLGYRVKGSATSLEKATLLQKSGFDAYHLEISESAVSGSPIAFFEKVDYLVIMIPPGLRRNTGANYVLKMTHLLTEIEKSKVKKVILVSSTSVYGDLSGTVTEATIPRPNTESGRQLLATEQLFLDALDINTTIVRFAGLIGLDRHPVHFLAKKQSLTNGNDPVNLIHLNDCIAIISAVIKKQWWNEIFNAVYPDHPLKKEYYPQEAEKKGLKLPEYDDVTMAMGKKIEPNWLLDVKKYRFNTPIQS